MTVFVALTRLLALPTGTEPATVALTAERRWTLSHDRAPRGPIGGAVVVRDAQESENESGKITAERLRVSVRRADAALLLP